MNGPAYVLLESLRLARYSAPTPCYICGEGNPFDAERCAHCQAPMALAHQARQLKAPPRMAAVLGPAGVGKTVFLGMMTDMLSRPGSPLQLLARGAFSVSLQQATIDSLSHCRFPEKTPNEPDRWNWAHFQLQSAAQKKKTIEMILPDMSGDAILEEVNHPYTYPVIRSFLERASALLLLVDAAHLVEGEQDQAYFAIKILSYLNELDDDPKHGWSHRPVALVLTKCDRCDHAFDDAAMFLERHAPNLLEHCRRRFHRQAFFAVGVAGACAVRHEIAGKVLAPLRVEPRGVIQPFLWLNEQLK